MRSEETPLVFGRFFFFSGRKQSELPSRLLAARGNLRWMSALEQESKPEVPRANSGPLSLANCYAGPILLVIALRK
jgi:hypothetical protein